MGRKPNQPAAPQATSGRSVTIKDLAAELGLSITTISRALNNAPELSAETRERVQRIAAEIGYVPDRTALRLKTGRTHVIGLVMDSHDEVLGFGHSMVSGLTSALRGTPYHLVIMPSLPNAATVDPILYVLRNKAADGIIFSRTEHDDARVKLLLEADFPFVSHGRTELDTPHPYVDYDNFAFAYHAVQRLASKGRKKVTIILPPPGLTFGHHLRDGFMAAVSELGLACEILPGATIDSSAEGMRLATMAQLAAPGAPDGFICTGDAAALSQMAGITDFGLTIGKDVDVVVKQTSGIFSQVRPRIDAIFEDTMLAGRQLGELLLRRIQGAPIADLQVLHQPEIWF